MLVPGINFHDHSSLLDVLVVIDIHLDDIAGNSRADRIKMSVNLGVVGGFVAGEITPKQDTGRDHNQCERYENNGSTQLGAAPRGRNSLVGTGDYAGFRRFNLG